MPFDRAGAKAAGYTDAEIDAYLAQAQSRSARKAPANNGPRPGFMPPSLMLRATRAGAKYLSPALATAGGIVGGGLGAESGPLAPVLAPSLGLAGAQWGGQAGEVLRQLVMNEPLNPSVVPAEGAKQGLLELLGLGTAGTAGALGKSLVRGSVDKTVARELGQRFPEIDALAEQLRRRVGTTKGGIAKIAAKEASSTGQLKGAIAKAEAGGMKRTLGEVAQPVIAAIEKAEGRPLTMAERKQTEKEINAMMGEAIGERSFGIVKREPVIPAQPASKILTPQGQPATPARAARRPKVPFRPIEEQAAKQVLQRRPSAQGAYKAQRESRAIAANPDLAQKLASSERTALEQIPGVGELNKETQRLMALRLLLEDAVSRGAIRANPLNMRIGPVGLHLLKGIVDPSIDISRGLMSNTGLVLTHPAFREATRQVPRFLEALTRGGAQ